MANKSQAMSLRFAPGLVARLEVVAKRLGLKKHDLAQKAVEAAVEAIERNGFSLVLPIQFDVRQIPIGKVNYAARTSESLSLIEERAEQPKKKAG